MVENYTITLDDVQAFLDSKRDDEPIGVTCDGGKCLLAQVVKAKYPEIADIIVSSSAISIMLSRGNRWIGVEMENGVSESIDSFDELVEWGVEQTITKRRWLEAKAVTA